MKTLSLLKTTTVKIRKKKGGYYSNGHWVEECEKEDACVRANVQPLSGRELLQVPEGDRERQNKWLYTSFDVQINDTIRYENEWYEVQVVEDWQDFCIDYRRARILKLDRQEDEH